MNTQRGLNTCHPLVSMLYFLAVMAFAMVFLHPLYSAISLTAAFAYSLCLKGKKAALFILRFPLPLLAVTALVNLLVNNYGSTVLFSWPWGQGSHAGKPAVRAIPWGHGGNRLALGFLPEPAIHVGKNTVPFIPGSAFSRTAAIHGVPSDSLI